MARVLSCIQPTGQVHLGNYLGALRNWVAGQHAGDVFHGIVDLHALTVTETPGTLGTNTLDLAAMLFAVGLDPDVATIFVQSHVPEHNQLAWVFECIGGFGEASRMTQFKDKSAKQGSDRTVVGLFTYPFLQASDIMLYQPQYVPVGEDQRQHIELTRDLGQRFNSRYKETFTIPEAYILKAAAKINDLQDPTAKMSKSSESSSGVIDILDSNEVNSKKIKSAVTDMGKEVKFDEKEKPGVSNLLTIHSALSGKSIPDLENEFQGKGYGDFKGAVAEVVTSYLSPIRERTQELLKDEGELRKILKVGSEKAQAVAAETLRKTYDALGLVPPLK